MKRIGISIALLAMLSAVSATSLAKDEFPVLQGPYFGQKTPGLTPEVFAPGLVSIEGRYEFGMAFSPDLKEMYFSGNKEGDIADMYYSKVDGDTWTPIEKLSFTKGKADAEMEPFVTYDNKRIYFTGYKSDYTNTNIWYVDRTDTGWSDAVIIDSPLNKDEVMYSTLAKNGDLFYTNILKSKTYVAPIVDGKYPEAMEANIDFGVHAFISPDQDYLLVDDKNQEDENRKDRDIYVYFKNKDGSWSKPINLGEPVNSEYGETVPYVTPDGKYLFFGRYNEQGGISNFYWVSTEVIENVRPKT
ncbi:PD40 domain-containing protein [Thalassotalea sp. Y01]|uniref:PD40 domain-containing protein n=1 Tax=Thalassotalea sp. Y01 TaxID=2729613 RepID=UPI00145E08AC|nr:PD40 domain-containing protein [Thalassotalea sp. Y01]NMP17716.1 hypothetical protein [Thalassotalea sp. Y01]